jgi:hypothetical protein
MHAQVVEMFGRAILEGLIATENRDRKFLLTPERSWDIKLFFSNSKMTCQWEAGILQTDLSIGSWNSPN